MTTVTLCSIMLVVFFAIMIFVGFYTRRHTTDVNGFVLLRTFSRPHGLQHLPWYFILLNGYFRWICRTVWMEF